MTIYDFQLGFAFIFFKDENKGIELHFFPLSNGKTTGGMLTRKDGYQMGGEYSLKEENGNLLVSWNDGTYVFVETELGFNLIDYATSSVAYSLTRPVQ